MNKLLTIALGCLAVSACVPHETDTYVMEERRAARHQEYRQEHGCQYVRNHDDYRRCILNTRALSSPRTFTPVIEYGQSVAVISDRGCNGGCARRAAPPAAYMEVETVETVCERARTPQQVVVTPTQVVVDQNPVVVSPAPVVVNPTQVIMDPNPVVINPSTVTIEPTPVIMRETPQPAPQPEPKKSWWQKKEESRQQRYVVCPCQDPNDPCPECYDK